MRTASSVCVAIGVAFALPASVQALSFAVASGSVGPAYGCSDAGCSNPSFESAAGAVVTGTVTLDEVTGVLGFSLQATDLVLDGSSRGISQIVFSGLTYSALGLTSAFDGQSWVLDPGGTARLVGTYSQDGTPAALDLEVGVGGACGIAGGSIDCSLVFGTSGFVLDIGKNNQRGRFFEHTVTSMAPEPSTVALVLLGLVLLQASRRPAR